MSVLYGILGLGVVTIGAYFFYGIFAEQLGQLIKNKRESGMTITNQVKLMVNTIRGKK